ncbi:MAG: DUF58 domain-containing protein [Planctomycetaceae bacterium]
MKHPLSLVGFGMLSSLLLALFMNRTMFFALLGMTAILIMAVVWPWITVKGIRGELTLEKRRSRVGEPVQLKLKLTNKWPWPLWGLIVSKGFFQDSNNSAGMSLSRVSAWTTATFTWKFTPRQRGVYPLELPQIETSFPLGLFACRVPLNCQSELIVWPETFDLEGLPDTQSFHLNEQKLTDRKAGDCGDLLGTRQFRQGDSLRRIHWGQTARTQNLIVCERQAPAATSLELIIDANCYEMTSSAADFQIEKVLSIAASIVKSVVSQNGFISCHFNGTIFEPGKGNREYERLMDGLARVPRGGDLNQLNPSIPRYVRHSSTFVVGPQNSPLFNSLGDLHGLCHLQLIRVESVEHQPECNSNLSYMSERSESWKYRLAHQWKRGRLNYGG